jgi:hypothetical protein
MRLALTVLVALILALLAPAGCSGREDVVITAIDRHDTSTGLVTLPADMSNLRLQIYAGDERLPARPVRGDASGRIVVKGVPDGPFVIAAETVDGARWWWSSESHDVEWTWRYAGRPDARPAEVQQPIALAVGGLAAWTSSDSLVAYSLETSTEMSPVIQPMLATGSTSIEGTFDWNASAAWSSNTSGRPYLMDAGDHFTLAQTTSRFEDGLQLSTMTSMLDIDAPAQDSGAALTIAGAMTALEATASSRFTVDHAAFAGALPTPPTASRWDIALYQAPAWSNTWALGPSVFSLGGGASVDGGPETTIQSYPLPFDAGWERWVWASFEADDLGGTYAISMSRLAEPGYVLGPRATFASSVLLDDQSIATGTVGWDGASAIDLVVAGADEGFIAYVYRLEDEMSSTARSYVGALISKTSDIIVPPGVFAIGERYEIQVRIGAEDADGYAYSFSTLGPFSFSPR